MYNFIVKFITPEYKGIIANDNSIKIDEINTTLSSIHGEVIKNSNTLKLYGSFPYDGKKASIELQKIEQSLRIASLECHLGVIVTNKTIYKKNEYEIANINASSSMKACLSTGTAVNKFKKSLVDIYKQYETYKISESQNAAIDILNSSFYENSTWAQFIMCISVIEILSPLVDQDKEFIDEIDKLCNHVSNNISDENMRDRILDTLKKNKRKSIVSSCTRTIKEYLNKKRSKTFNNLYEIRSRIVHENLQSQSICTEAQPAFNLAKDLLLMQIKGQVDSIS